MLLWTVLLLNSKNHMSHEISSLLPICWAWQLIHQEEKEDIVVYTVDQTESHILKNQGSLGAMLISLEQSTIMAGKVILCVNIWKKVSKTNTKQTTDLRLEILIAVKIFRAENEGIMFLRNIVSHLQVHTMDNSKVHWWQVTDLFTVNWK